MDLRRPAMTRDLCRTSLQHLPGARDATGLNLNVTVQLSRVARSGEAIT